MKLSVLVEIVKEGVYRASSGEPFVFIAEGSTRETALIKLRELIEVNLTNGTEMIEFDFSDQNNPWLNKVGFLDPNDPVVQEWKEIMVDHRRRFDEDPDAFYEYMSEMKSAYFTDDDGTD